MNHAPDISRTIAVQMPDGTEGYAHASDVLALLSRTNYRGVVKFLLALQALHKHTGIPLEELIDTTASPEHAASFDGNERMRVESTLALACQMAANQELNAYVSDLYLRRPEFR